MKKLLTVLLLFSATVCFGQRYQSMPQPGYGPVLRMLLDSNGVLSIPIGVNGLRNITGGRNMGQIRYNKADSCVYVYSGNTWLKLGGLPPISPKVDSVVLTGTTFCQWINGVPTCYTITPNPVISTGIDSITATTTSICQWSAGVPTCYPLAGPGVDSVSSKLDSVCQWRNGVSTCYKVTSGVVSTAIDSIVISGNNYCWWTAGVSRCITINNTPPFDPTSIYTILSNHEARMDTIQKAAYSSDNTIKFAWSNNITRHSLNMNVNLDSFYKKREVDGFLAGATKVFAGYGLKKLSDSSAMAADTANGKVLFSPFQGQTAYCLGNSFTFMQLYQEALVRKLGVTIVNDGASGATITGSAASGTPSIVKRLNTALATQPNILIIQDCTNDWALGRTLGTMANTSADTATFYGAMKYILQRCASQSYPLKVVIVNMIARGSRTDYAAQKTYVDAMNEVCAIYNTPVVNMFSGSGITYENLALYCPDGIHPTSAEGRKKYTDFLVSSIFSPVGAFTSANSGSGSALYAGYGLKKLSDSTTLNADSVVLDARYIKTGQNYWSTIGIGGTDTLTNFLGTTDNKPMIYKVNGNHAGVITDSLAGNVGYGYGALKNGYKLKTISNSIGEKNTAFGLYSLKTNTVGQANTGVGANTLTSNTTGGGNSALGESALYSNTTGGGNNAFGQRALTTNTTGANNLAFGAQALRFNRTGSSNIGLGADALSANTTADGNTAVGYQALKSDTTGTKNTSVGFNSLSSNITGSFNTAIGGESYNLSTNSYNSGLGYASGNANTSGSLNTSLGALSLYENTTGSNNVALGVHSGRYITGGSSPNTVTDNSVYLGYMAMALASGQTNQIVIGANAIGSGSNTATIGDMNITRTILRGTVSADTMKPLLIRMPQTAGAQTQGTQVVSLDANNTTVANGIGWGSTRYIYSDATNSITANTTFWKFSGFVSGSQFQNPTTANNATLALANTGTTISRNIADANSALIISNANASSTGTIVTFSSTINSSAVTVTRGGLIGQAGTFTAIGTTGAQTINKPTGVVNFATGATSLVVTNSLCTTSSVILATVQTNDGTMKSVACVPASGSFTIYANAAATGTTAVYWQIKTIN